MADQVILIVGRLSGPKNDVILSILKKAAPKVLRAVPRARFLVVGGPVAEEHSALEKKNPSIAFAGHQKNLDFFYRKASLVVGAGRVALEAMALGKPVVAVGERLYLGPLLPGILERAKASNFGDCAARENFDWDRMAKDLIALLRQRTLREKAAKTGSALVRAEYDMARIFPRMEGLYQEVLATQKLSDFHEIPVLMYHRVTEGEPARSKYNLHVRASDLEKQLQFLKVRGFQTVTFMDLLSGPVPRKPVILTFDDGYEDNHKFLFPLLRKYGQKAVVYVLGDRGHRTNFWDTPQGEAEASLLRPEQMREMAASGLVEFGAHSMDHLDLTSLDPSGAQRQVAGAKEALESFLQRPVPSFAYPYGAVNEDVKRITREAGYTFGVAVNSGPTRFTGDLMEIRRVHMFPRTSLFEYFKKTSGYYLRYRKLMGKA